MEKKVGNRSSKKKYAFANHHSYFQKVKNGERVKHNQKWWRGPNGGRFDK